MRQILLNSLPMHAPEKLVLVVFFSVQSRIESCSDHRQLPSCATRGRARAPVAMRADQFSGSLRFRL
jgi:hypothetical protein